MYLNHDDVLFYPMISANKISTASGTSLGYYPETIEQIKFDDPEV
jgi:hypothetical protein